MRGFKLLLATGAVGLVLTGLAIGTAGVSVSLPDGSDGSSEDAVPALARRHAANAYANLPVSFGCHDAVPRPSCRYSQACASAHSRRTVGTETFST